MCSDQGEEWGGLLFRGGGFLEKGCLYFLYSQVAHALGKQTIAEYVEDSRMLEMLRNYGVDYAQGNYIGKPREALMNVARLRYTHIQTVSRAD